MWFLLQKCSKKPSCSSCLSLLFTGDFPKIKCCWQKGLLNTLEYMFHWVCRWGPAGHSVTSGWLGYSFHLGHVGGDTWSKHKQLRMLKHFFQGYCSGEKSRSGTGPAGNLKARSMPRVDGGWKATISGLVPKVHGVGNSGVLQKVFYMFYLLLGFSKVPSFGCCQHQLGHQNKKALNLPKGGFTLSIVT